MCVGMGGCLLGCLDMYVFTWVVGGRAGRWDVDGWVEWVFRRVVGNLGGWLTG